MPIRVHISALVLVVLLTAASNVQAQPNLLITEASLETLQATGNRPELFDRAYNLAKSRVMRSMQEGITVPLPKDPGGGYTHERHKENYKVIHDAGMLYLIDGDQGYADHVKAMLDAYADMYPTLPLHPEQKEQSPGKLFWQGLNESVWLVYAIQGYNAVSNVFDDATKSKIEGQLLRPMADFLSIGSPETFRKIHNHGTWAAAAVGMTGYALRDPELVQRAILGLDGDAKTGFLAQLEQLFSPDGYYTEGPYYQRYALMPFVLFGQVIENNEPARKIFDFRDKVLLKAIDTTIQQSYGGKFFGINDAIKEKGLDTIELIYGVSIAYGLTGSEELLSIAREQGITVLTGDGYTLAAALNAGKVKPYNYTTMLLSDGPGGDQGGLGILRMGEGADKQTLVVKNTSQGMGHGHFDKLAFQLYDNGNEIISDYGAARFLNVPSKEGGRYLPENTSWAKQSIAHNTLVIGEESHFDGNWREGQKYWPEITFFNASKKVNVISAKMTNAYKDAEFSRTIIQVKPDFLSHPVVMDIVRGESENKTSFDLPIYFDGQLVDVAGELKRNTNGRAVLGDDNGYQHLWLDAEGALQSCFNRYSWLTESRFYTSHISAPKGSKIVFVRLGANDPNFNLREQQGIIARAHDLKSASFVTVLEPHGVYDPAAEFTSGSESQISQMDHEVVDGADIISITARDGGTFLVAISGDADAEKNHTISFNGQDLKWTGFYGIFE